MCAIQTALSAAHFISERKSSLTDVLNGATALSERFADEGSIVTRPLQGEDLVERAHSGFELFNTTSGALIFIADKNGSILLHTGDEAFTGANVPPDYIAQLDEGSDIFETGTLDGVYNAKYYTAGRRITVGGQDGYLFAASPMNALGSYMTDMLAMFGISAAAILLLCSVLCWVLARRITGPIEDISEAARRLGIAQPTLNNKLRLLALNEEQQAYCIANGLTERHARAVLRLPESEQRSRALAQFVKKKMNARQADEYVEQCLQQKKPPRRRPVPIPGSEFTLDVDTVVIAIGTSPNPLIKSTTRGLEVNRKGGIVVNEEGLTSHQNVYAGGDAVTGAATVILAMGAGKLAAKSIDEALSK